MNFEQKLRVVINVHKKSNFYSVRRSPINVQENGGVAKSTLSFPCDDDII
jgi:hypothetical protein